MLHRIDQYLDFDDFGLCLCVGVFCCCVRLVLVLASKIASRWAFFFCVCVCVWRAYQCIQTSRVVLSSVKFTLNHAQSHTACRPADATCGFALLCRLTQSDMFCTIRYNVQYPLCIFSAVLLRFRRCQHQQRCPFAGGGARAHNVNMCTRVLRTSSYE